MILFSFQRWSQLKIMSYFLN